MNGRDAQPVSCPLAQKGCARQGRPDQIGLEGVHFIAKPAPCGQMVFLAAGADVNLDALLLQNGDSKTVTLLKAEHRDFAAPTLENGDDVRDGKLRTPTFRELIT